MHLLYFYIIVKTNYSAFFLWHVFCYLCFILVRIQQNIRRCKIWPWISAILVCDWLTPNQWRVIQNKTTRCDDLYVNLLPSACSEGMFCILSGQSQFSRKPQHPMKCFLIFYWVAFMYSCCTLLDPDQYKTWISKQTTYKERWIVALYRDVKLVRCKNI